MRIHPSMKTLATRPAKLAGSRAARRRGGEQVISPHDILSDVEAASVASFLESLPHRVHTF